MKVALLIGHNSNKKGAYSEFLDNSEYMFYKKVVRELELRFCNTDFQSFEHDATIKGYTKRIKATAKRINKQDFDLVISLHFNSFDGTAHGCETLHYYKSKQGKAYANKFSRFINNELDIRFRGTKALTNKRDRGFAAVYYTNAPTILIEPFFGDNEEDCRNIVSAENFARVLNKFIKTL